MNRKHLRFKKLILGLAVGLVITALSAPAVLAKPISGNGPLDPWAYNVIHGSAQATVKPMSYSAVSGPLGVAAYQSFAGTTPTAQHVTSQRFNWGDAGMGASVAFGAVLLLLTAVALGRHYRSRIDRTGLVTS